VRAAGFGGPTTPVDREPLALAIPREVGKSPATALSNRYLQAMLDEEDLEIYQRLLGDC